jgi:hypothetical protein
VKKEKKVYDKAGQKYDEPDKVLVAWPLGVLRPQAYPTQAQCQRLFYESLYKEQRDTRRELNPKIEPTMVSTQSRLVALSYWCHFWMMILRLADSC